MRRICLSWFVMLILSPALVRADPTDPFDPANKAPVLSLKTVELVKVIEFDLKLAPAKAKRGEIVRVTITGTPAKTYHAVAVNQRTDKQDRNELRLNYAGIDGLKPLWPLEESTPELALQIDGIPAFEHDRRFTLSQDLLIDPHAKPGQYDLMLTIDHLQVCNQNVCVGPAAYRPLFAPLEVLEGDPVPPPADLAARLQGPPPAKIVTPTKEQLAALKAAPPGPGDAGKVPPAADANNLGSFLGFASLSAFLMLLTPCVFPMIPITVNFFLKQSEKEHHNPLAMASVYSGTIIVLLTLIMLVLGKFVIDLANNEWFNLALGLVLIIFALSLFGMYEIELPHFLARYTSAHEGKGGLIGAMFMAMTFTITSFTCTGPFLGLMLGSVAGIQPPRLNLALGALVYSTTFAAPFFVLALFPSMLKKLPRSGSWLNSVKVTMGFLELGAALKFLSNADFAFFPGSPQVFNYDTVLAAWIALSISCCLYLLGLFRLPNDDRVEQIGVIRMLIAVGFLGLAVYLAPAMFGLHPAGVVGDNALAFLPIRTGHESDAPSGTGGTPGSGNTSGHKDWYLDYDDAWKDAVKNDKLIFIDFTGVNCANCRYNEGSVFPLAQVNAELKKFVKVSLYTDTVPSSKLTRAESQLQGNRNQNWQLALAKGNVTLPYYVLLRPDREAALEGGTPKGKIVGNANGAIRDVAGFVEVLKNAQTNPLAQLKRAE